MKRLLYTILGLAITLSVYAQEGEESYVYPTDPLVKENLEEWQDIKFGLMMHWGTYSQWGIVESWSLCTEDWINRRTGTWENYDQYKIDYRNLQKTFNPTEFDPEKWAKAAKDAGMKYMVFTTKHHDGFAMFDTKTTDYKITSENTPFHTNPKANITKEIFKEFREEGFKIGAYFSKPDWNTEYYWWPYYNTGPRHVNYDPEKHPDRWQKFKDHTYTQIEELMTGYGEVDILWLDGAWVRPYENTPDHYKEWAWFEGRDQDVDIPRIAKMARSHQPGLLVVDRWVAGAYENYLTPENRVPEKPVLVPWEAPITMTPGWSYNENARYKSTRQLVHTLVGICSKGGNFLLNIGPSPEGDWLPAAYDRLKGIGEWMKVNSEAIYDTRAIAPYTEGKVALTQNRHTKAVYATYLAGEGETKPPAKIWVSTLKPAKGAKITMLGVKGNLKYEIVGEGFVAEIPKSAINNPPCKDAWSIKISAVEE